MENRNHILRIVENIFDDIRAEVIIADLVEKGIGMDEIVLKPRGIFKRRYSRDVESIRSSELENGQKILEINVNRDGLYDVLPEGLFHERPEKNNSDRKNISKASKKAKLEEKAAREFFLPFENEIFRQGVETELEERKLLSRFNEKLFDDIYPEIWNLHSSLPRKYIHRLALLLHFAHKIAGNHALMAKCLETILEEHVEIKAVWKCASLSRAPESGKGNGSSCTLGKGEVGINFICGEEHRRSGRTLEFAIGPLINTKVADYITDGPLHRFLNCYYGYFVPLDFDVQTHISVDRSKQGFELNTPGYDFALGYETAI